MKISALTVNYNGERFLKAMFEHVLPYVDELVILDSGSQDDSVQIISEYQDKFPDKIKLIVDSIAKNATLENNKRVWRDEFKLRNRAKYECTGDWILQQDIDEFYPEEFMKNMRELAKNTEHRGYFFPKLNFWASKKNYRTDGAWHPDVGGLKFYKNEEDLIYCGESHPTIWGKYGMEMYMCPDMKGIPGVPENQVIRDKDNYLEQYPIFHYGRIYERKPLEEGSRDMIDEDAIQLKEWDKGRPNAERLIEHD